MAVEGQPLRVAHSDPGHMLDVVFAQPPDASLQAVTRSPEVVGTCYRRPSQRLSTDRGSYPPISAA